jgi:Uncharacterized proteins, homologs of lactam utilization protein B
MRVLKAVGEIRKWARNFIRAVRFYDADVSAMRLRVLELEKIIRDRTSIGADIRYSGEGYVVVVGRYQGHDYVQTFSLLHDDLNQFIRQLKNMERYGRVNVVDAPPGMRTVIKKELIKGN